MEAASMTNRLTLTLSGWAICLAAMTSPVAAEAATPNVVLIVADDLGWKDLGCSGSTFHETPRIDGLAREGLRFNQAYAASPLCSPTRASILTGLSPARVGITAPVCHLRDVILKKGLAESAEGKVKPAKSVTRLDTKYWTLGEALRDAGFATAHIGKWHLGAEPFSPLEHGFDVDIPHSPAPSPLHYGFLAPWPVWPGQGKKGEHLEDRMAEEAARFIRAHRDRPFFLNLWLWSVHSPWQAKPELVDQYREKADPDNPQRHPVYAAMCKTMDDAVGTVLDALEEAQLAERTIVLFMSDNGPWVVPNREASVMPPEFHDVPVSSTAPLRGGKAEIYEGGTRVPLIVRWPGVTRPGEETNALFLSTDLYPTILEMIGATPRPDLALDGVSQVSTIKNGLPVRKSVFVHFPHGKGHLPGFKPSSSLRVGDWKLIRFYADGPGGIDRHELYNLAVDVGEQNDLATVEPERLETLSARLDERLRSTEAVIPQANPDWNLLPRGGPHSEVRKTGEGLHIVNAVKDAYVAWTDLPETGKGPFTVEFRMRSTFTGVGQVFWRNRTKPSYVDQTADFSPNADGVPHTYSVSLPAVEPLLGLRLDPGTSTGEAHVLWIRLKGVSGKTLKEWRYVPRAEKL